MVTRELIAKGNLEMNIKHKRASLTKFPNTLRFVKNTPLRVVFSTLSSVFANEVKEMWSFVSDIKRFSFECRKLIGFVFATLHNWLKKFAPIFHPIRSKNKTNRD